MKKYFYLLIAACFLFTFCSKEEKEKGKDLDTRGRMPLCSAPPYIFSIFVKEESADYALFLKDVDQIDKESIYFFKKSNGKEVRSNLPLGIDFYQGKNIRIAAFGPLEFYLRNKEKSYKMDILGIYGVIKMVQFGKEYNCGYYFELDEVYINDVKREVQQIEDSKGIFLD